MMSTNTPPKCRACICSLDATAQTYDMRILPELAEKFEVCTDLNVERDEENLQLPSELCQMCRDQLEQSYAFRAKCRTADAQLRMEITEHGKGRKGGEQKKRLLRENRMEKAESAVEEIEIELPEIEIGAEDTIATAVRIEEEQEVSPVKPDAGSFRCSSCSMRFSMEHQLVAHQRQHKGLMPYPCTEEGCERAYNRFHSLSEHLKEHLVSGRFRCEQEGCQKVYRHKPTLTMHLRKFHKLGPELKSHVCEICGKVFNSTSVLNDHRYTHKDQSELPHACPEADCPRRFASKEKLKVHLMRHAGIKNFSCSFCGMRKTTRNELKIHMNYHTLERTWPCRYCSKVCNSSGNLKMHVRAVHERAKDYACSYCERSFAKADTRKYHEMTHTGEKPHKCEECGKQFTQPAALRTHRKIHERQRKGSAATVYTLLISNENASAKQPD